MNKKPFFEKYLPYLLFIFIGYCIADVLILNYRDMMLPTEPPPAQAKPSFAEQMQNRGNYQVITTRNIFSSDGIIPDALVAQGQQPGQQQENEPTPSNLPLTLKGTIVHTNPAKSIATIEVKSKNLTNAYPVGVNIENLATLERVERRKAIIRNLNNRMLEYIEMKEASKISFGIAAAPGGGAGEIAEVAPNKFEIKRSDLLKYTNDMASVLQQAAMAPRRGANGEIECFKFLSIQPGSIYTQLKFQNGDCISGVNGEKVDSPAKAMEMYNALKNSANLKLQLERDGRPLEYDYTIK